MIQNIKDMSDMIILPTGREPYNLKPEHHSNFQQRTYDTSYKVQFYFWKDLDGDYMNGMQYWSTDTFFWEWVEVEEFYKIIIGEKHIGLNSIEFSIPYMRFYGEPKLEKPKELKGIKQSFSIDYVPNKCRCQVFIRDSGVWIKHNDYFSNIVKPDKHELGMPLNYFAEKHLGRNRPSKFIYEDAWGSVVLRNQAYVKIEGLIDVMQSHKNIPSVVSRHICKLQEAFHGFEEYELASGDMERFWEKVITELRKTI